MERHFQMVQDTSGVKDCEKIIRHCGFNKTFFLIFNQAFLSTNNDLFITANVKFSKVVKNLVVI